MFRQATVVLTLGLAAGSALGQISIDPFYSADYSFNDLGTVPGVPPNYGGVTFKHDDPNVLLIGGTANTLAADVFAVEVVRGCGSHITGFKGRAAFFADAFGVSGGIDGGLDYGPGNVLFYTSYSDNRLGQILPGSTGPNLLTDLTPLGVAASTGTLQFVPQGFAGAGKLKILSYNTGFWFSFTVAPDGSGTYQLTNEGINVNIGGGPEGLVYVGAGNPHFAADSVLVCEYSTGRVVSYEIDANGDPLVATRRIFITGLNGAEGATIDPLTGDFIFATFGGGNRIVVVDGFDSPEPLAADFNNDKAVNGIDLGILLAAWSQPAGTPGCGGQLPCDPDLNGNCLVDGLDLGILLNSWTQ